MVIVKFEFNILQSRMKFNTKINVKLATTQMILTDFVFFSLLIANYVSWRPYCCKEAGRTDYACTPNKVPKTDYVHRFSGIRCLNMTRPLTFQTSGCLANTTTPLRVNIYNFSFSFFFISFKSTFLLLSAFDVEISFF